MTFAALAATEAPAEHLNLLELIGTGTRRAARPQQKPAESRRKSIRVERETPAKSVATNIVNKASKTVAEAKAITSQAPALSSIAAEALARTNVVKTAPIVMTNFVERVVTNVINQVATNYIDRVATNYIDRVVTNYIDRVATNFVDRIVTNVIERIVTNAVTRSTFTNALGRVIIKREPGPPRITAKTTYYDRKEGYAVFSGKVHVDTEEYQLHAKKAYVFFEGTNELRRIVATGNVAITNELKRAYGTKASYYRDTGMIVLYGDSKTPAEVRDESKREDQVVKGTKIKFWTTSEQIEVVDARISAPVDGGMGEIKKGLLPK